LKVTLDRRHMEAQNKLRIAKKATVEAQSKPGIAAKATADERIVVKATSDVPPQRSVTSMLELNEAAAYAVAAEEKLQVPVAMQQILAERMRKAETGAKTGPRPSSSSSTSSTSSGEEEPEPVGPKAKAGSTTAAPPATPLTPVMSAPPATSASDCAACEAFDS